MFSTESLGKLVLRLTVGVLLLMHGVHKLLTGIEPIKHMVAAYHVPELLAYGVYLGEILGPLLVILGVFSRCGAALIVINMIVAVVLAGMGQLIALGPMGGYALELEAFYLFGGLAVMLLGAGSISLGGENGRWN
ncbi:MAG: DoxX family protein [Pseudomonadota bacterium]|nr:DoxX family protein [Pseudomonadota bacterium]